MRAMRATDLPVDCMRLVASHLGIEPHRVSMYTTRTHTAVDVSYYTNGQRVYVGGRTWGDTCTGMRDRDPSPRRPTERIRELADGPPGSDEWVDAVNSVRAYDARKKDHEEQLHMRRLMNDVHMVLQGKMAA